MTNTSSNGRSERKAASFWSFTGNQGNEKQPMGCVILIKKVHFMTYNPFPNLKSILYLPHSLKFTKITHKKVTYV
jgi:hypothetical protein